MKSAVLCRAADQAIHRRIRIITSSFEAWYQKQTHYVKISERSNENGIYREA